MALCGDFTDRNFLDLSEPLQGVVGHADRLCELLAIQELTPPTDEWAAAWLIGRAEELAWLAQHLLGAWREGRLADARAAAMLEEHVGLLHRGLAEQLGCRAPWCCRTAPAVHEAITAAITTVERPAVSESV
jgi:hypothetical protein